MWCRGNITFCDICCFCLWESFLEGVVNYEVFYIHYQYARCTLYTPMTQKSISSHPSKADVLQQPFFICTHTSTSCSKSNQLQLHPARLKSCHICIASADPIRIGRRIGVFCWVSSLCSESILQHVLEQHSEPVSYTHLTLPTKRIV